jgi:putative RNA 2'-phosphotransferase
VDQKKRSKFLSLVLRHQPQIIGVTLSKEGWIDVDTLLEALSQRNMAMTRQELEDLVATNDKKRFEFSEDGTMIRACQGHSLKIDLGLPPRQPPEVLYHGTATRFLDSIVRDGLRPGSRTHVHLSQDVATATKVGSRHGTPVVLKVDSRAMTLDGHQFYKSNNNVWLTLAVPPQYLHIE